MRRPRIYKVRDDPIETMNDIEFKRHFRFTKEHVLKLSEFKAEDLISDSNRGLPGDKSPQMFWCKNVLWIGAQVVPNDIFIYDVDVAWPGSTQDARIWNRSKVKLLRVVEETKNYYIAGGIGYFSLSYVRKRIRKVDKKVSLVSKNLELGWGWSLLRK